MWEYLISVLVFLIVSVSIQKIREEKDYLKIQAILPASIVSIFIFVIIHYRESFFNHEPMMGGNYFDTV
jgi:hypothetical protein